MPLNEAEFLKELRQAFAQEAQEHLQTMTSGLLALEQGSAGPDAGRVLEEVYRAAHSLKGAARAVSEHEVEALAHAMEDVFSAVRQGRLELRPEGHDELQRGLSLLEALLAGPETVDALVARELRSRLAGLAKGADAGGPHAPPSSPQPPPLPRSPETAQGEARAAAPPAPAAPVAPEAPGAVAIGAGPVSPRDVPAAPATPAGVSRKPAEAPAGGGQHARLDAFLLKAESLLGVRLGLEQRIAEVRALAATVARARKALAAPRRFPAAPDACPVTASQALDAVAQGLDDLLVRLRADLLSHGDVIRDLLEHAKRTLMFPFNTVTLSFPKMVRDLARVQGKEAELVVTGGETLVDKRILDSLKAPLTHMLRNAVDHGLETPDRRQAAGKPRRGTIRVVVSEAEGDKVEILVSDDGAGFDAQRLRRAAAQTLGLSREAAEALDRDALLELAFRSGVSSNDTVTDLSGRGLGLAIVQEVVDRLGGALSLDTAPGQGAALRVLLPLTLATFRGILVRVAGRIFVVPTAGVSRVLSVGAGDVRSVEGREIIAQDGRPCALAWLADILGLDRCAGLGRDADRPLPALLVGSGERRLALVVDAVLGEQEVLVKGLGRHLAGLRNIAGATVLGNGAVAPVLNTVDLLAGASRVLTPPAATGKEREQPRTVLVVEDSVTSRTLLKNILQSAGYVVRTAVDGLDGLAALRAAPADLAVLDVDMPRMDGFELTAAIRRDAQLASLPVILLTARGTREDREKGITLGANAYLVKTAFDQSNLLDVIRQYI